MALCDGKMVAVGSGRSVLAGVPGGGMCGSRTAPWAGRRNGGAAAAVEGAARAGVGTISGEAARARRQAAEKGRRSAVWESEGGVERARPERLGFWRQEGLGGRESIRAADRNDVDGGAREPSTNGKRKTDGDVVQQRERSVCPAASAAAAASVGTAAAQRARRG